MIAIPRKRPMVQVALILVTLTLLTPVTGPATAGAGSLQIKILSDRADLITGGDALVEVVVPQGVAPSQVSVFAGTRNVTSAFAVRQNKRLIGMLKGLASGAHDAEGDGRRRYGCGYRGHECEERRALDLRSAR